MGDPGWLIKNIPEIAEIKAQTREDPIVEFQLFPQRIRVNFKRLRITPFRETLIIEPGVTEDVVFESIGKIGAHIVEKLPHTPIKAIGHNFSFALDSDEEFTVDFFNLSSSVTDTVAKTLKRDARTTSSQIRSSVSLEGKDCQLNVTSEFNLEGKSLSFNFHHDMTNYSLSDIKSVIKSYPANYRLSLKIRDSLIK